MKKIVLFMVLLLTWAHDGVSRSGLAHCLYSAERSSLRLTRVKMVSTEPPISPFKLLWDSISFNVTSNIDPFISTA